MARDTDADGSGNNVSDDEYETAFRVLESLCEDDSNLAEGQRETLSKAREVVQDHYHLFHYDDRREEIDFEEDDPLAVFTSPQAVGWEWQAFFVDRHTPEKVYYGRVRSPMTHREWETGTFSQAELDDVDAKLVEGDIPEFAEVK